MQSWSEAIVRDLSEHAPAAANPNVQDQLLESLLKVVRATTQRPTLQDTLQNALTIAMQLTGAADGDLILVDHSGHVTHSILPTGPASGEQRETHILPIMQAGLAGWVSRHRQPALLVDTLADKRWLVPSGALARHRSALSVPILNGAGLLGILTLAHPQPGHFYSDHLRLISAAADEIALAVRNAEIFEAQRRMAERQITVYEVLRTVSGLHAPDTVAKLAVDAIVQFTPWSDVAIALPSDDHTQWTMCAARGSLAHAPGIFSPADESIVARAIRTREIQTMPDANDKAAQLCTHSELAVPLGRGPNSSGVLWIASDQMGGFDSDDMVLVGLIADAIALALDNARLYAQTQRHVVDMSALYAITRTTSRSLALEDVLEQALSSAITSLGFQAGLIALAEVDETGLALHEPAELKLATARGLPSEMDRLHWEEMRDTLMAHVHRARESLVVDDSRQGVPPEVGLAAEPIVRLGYRAFAGIPLLHQGQSLGALILLARQARSSSAFELALLGTIGQQIAGAVTNARLFQATLVASARSQALINSSRDGIIFLGMDGRVLILNRPAARLLRLPGEPQEWLGRSSRDLLASLHAMAPGAWDAALSEWRKLRRERTALGEGEFQVSPYTVRWVSLPVMTGAIPQGRLIVLYDVTDERATERLREDMTRTMVHDLRNPLNNIFGALDMVTKGMLGPIAPAQVEALQIAQDSACRMLDLVNGILDVSRLESGRMPVELRSFSLADLVSKTCQAQAVLAQTKRMRLESQVSPELPPVRADPALIGRVLQNLVGNAIKFTPAGGSVLITARNEGSAQQVRLVVQVIDTGLGLPAEIQPRLFQKFASGTQVERGSGLGLAFCKLALEAHGERIWAESRPGQGATFSFTLAVAK